jgi:aspartate aminotransferase-like enzyme
MSGLELWIPGPTKVAPEVLELMARPPIAHRGAGIQELIGAIEPGLRALFGARDVYAATCSGTTVMEMGLRNLVAKRVLVLACGAFGKRWADIAKANGMECELVLLEPGQGLSPELARTKVKGRGFDAVCLTQNETATGVFNPIPEIVAAVRSVEPEIAVLVDAVSSLSAVELDFDAVGADLWLAGVQKAIALPPGLAVYALSQRAIAKAETVPNRGWATDFLRARDQWSKHQTPATPSVSHLFALRRQLERIHQEGIKERAERHREMAAMVHDWATGCGHDILAEEGFRSPTVTCLRIPGRMPASILAAAADGAGVRLGGGYGDLKPEWFRIGHMGEHRPEKLRTILEAIDAGAAT